jgi:hypothetical protein
MSKRTPQKCVKVFHWINGYLAAKDNFDSWGICTTSKECRTIMIVVLMLMSGMDPHTISETWDGFGSWLRVGQSGCLGRSTTVDSVVESMSLSEVKIY